MKEKLYSSPAMRAVALVFICLLPLMIMRDVTPANELRYLSIADEAIEEAHVFTLTNQGEPYADKPPFYFWFIMLGKLLFGTHSVFFLSLLSFIPAAVIICVMDKWLMLVSKNTPGLSFGAEERFSAALLLGCSAMFIGTAVFLRMDMMMGMFIVLALYTFYKMYRGAGNFRTDSIMLPVYIFLALFTKGPVGLLMPVVSILLFLFLSGRIRDVGRYLGWKTWLVMAGLCAVWFAGVFIEGGVSYLENLLVHQTVDRAVDAFHHKEPFWYYMVAIWYSVAPFSLLLVPVAVLSLSGRSFGRNADGGFAADARKLFLIAVFGTFIMLSAFSSKLSIYLLPVYPFLAYLCPLSLKGCGNSRWLSAAIAVPAAVLSIAGACGVAALALHGYEGLGPGLSRLLSVLDEYSFADSPAAYAALSLLFAGGAVTVWLSFKRGTAYMRPVISMSVTLLLVVAACSPLLPEANDYIGYGNVCRSALRLSETSSDSGCRFVTLNVSRPENMDVYLGQDIVDFGGDEAAYLSGADFPHVLIVKTSAMSETLSAALAGRLAGGAETGEYSLFLVE